MRYFLKILALLAPATAFAAGDGGQQEYLAAAQTFEKLKAEALAKGDMPRLSDPRVREALGILSNKSRTFGTAAFPASDIAATTTLCAAANKASFAYQFYGMDTPLKEKRSADLWARAAATVELVVQNPVRFQDEVYPLLEFSVRCMAVSLPLLTAFVEKLPPEQMTDIRREGLVKMRLRVSGLVSGVIGSLDCKLLDCKGLREENRRLVFDTLARDLPVLSSALTIAWRSQLRDDVQKMRASVPDTYRPAAEAMLTALSDTRCEGLCRL